LAHIRGQENTSRENCISVPSNATIRSEDVKCGKSFCLRCPHGPYYYADWEGANGKLRKKYIGAKYDPSWKTRNTSNDNHVPKDDAFVAVRSEVQPAKIKSVNRVKNRL
jgi:hypothetical protein